MKNLIKFTLVEGGQTEEYVLNFDRSKNILEPFKTLKTLPISNDMQRIASEIIRFGEEISLEGDGERLSLLDLCDVEVGIFITGVFIITTYLEIADGVWASREREEILI